MLPRSVSFAKSLLLLLFALSSAAAMAHTKLDEATPADGATLQATPSVIRLAFNEPIETSLSSVRIVGPGGAVVAGDKPSSDKDDDRSLVVRFPKLSSGSYRVEWATVGRDGHRVKGTLRFTVK
jgi:methionine-rich copper-binding protein CopC